MRTQRFWRRWRFALFPFGLIAAYSVGLLTLVTVAAFALSSLVDEIVDSVPPNTPPKHFAPRAYMQVLADNEWSRWGHEFSRRSGSNERLSTERATSTPRSYDEDDNWDRSKSANRKPRLRAGSFYRTMCVRLCDGFYFPMSFSTSPRNFGRDAEACEKSCGSPARLYVYPNTGGAIEDMKTREGEPYAKLKTAFLYRTVYDESCKCKPHAWEAQAQERHRVYALIAQARKGDRVTAAELKRVESSPARALSATLLASSSSVSLIKPALAGLSYGSLSTSLAVKSRYGGTKYSKNAEQPLTADIRKSWQRLDALQPRQAASDLFLGQAGGQSAPKVRAANGAGTPRPAMSVDQAGRQSGGSDPNAMVLGGSTAPSSPTGGNLDQWHLVFQRGM